MPNVSVQEIFVIRLLYQTRKALIAYKADAKGNPQKATLVVIVTNATLCTVNLFLIGTSVLEYYVNKTVNSRYIGVALQGLSVQLHTFIFFKMKEWALTKKSPRVANPAVPKHLDEKETKKITAVASDTVKLPDRQQEDPEAHRA